MAKNKANDLDKNLNQGEDLTQDVDDFKKDVTQDLDQTTDLDATESENDTTDLDDATELDDTKDKVD
ncbi:MAG: hypothetical protein QM632_06550, partial [Micrococcaceae bacterium]